MKKKKPAKKKVVKKKKPIKKAKKATAKPKAKKTLKPIGKVTHFYTQIRVAIVKFNTKVKSGSKLNFRGATTDFEDVAKSMQYNHALIAVAPKGKQIGIKVKKTRARRRLSLFSEIKNSVILVKTRTHAFFSYESFL